MFSACGENTSLRWGTFLAVALSTADIAQLLERLQLDSLMVMQLAPRHGSTCARQGCGPAAWSVPAAACARPTS